MRVFATWFRRLVCEVRGAGICRRLLAFVQDKEVSSILDAHLAISCEFSKSLWICLFSKPYLGPTIIMTRACQWAFTEVFGSRSSADALAAEVILWSTSIRPASSAGSVPAQASDLVGSRRVAL